MVFFGVVFIIGGVLTTAFGALQNTILFNLFADLNARLARAHLETDFEISWIFSGPGTMTIIFGMLAVIVGIVFIVIGKKRNRHH